MKITVTRTFEPIVREVSGCKNCPWHTTEPDMSTTHWICQHPQYSAGDDLGCYKDVMPDIDWGTPEDKFSKHCPYFLPGSFS